MKLTEANAMLDAAVARATTDGVAVAVVVLDASGSVVALQRMDGVQPSAALLAEKKAYGAVNFRAPTHAVAESFPPDLKPILLAAEPRVTFLPGGVPATRDGQVIGAIGIAGGTADQDLSCCDAALKALP